MDTRQVDAATQKDVALKIWHAPQFAILGKAAEVTESMSGGSGDTSFGHHADWIS